MSFTSDDVNLLIYRYLQESGFTHTLFAFQNEAKIPNELLAEKPRRGVLINFIQKGLLYTEIETHIRQDGGEVDCQQPFYITREHVCKVEPKSATPAASGSAASTTGGASAATPGGSGQLNTSGGGGGGQLVQASGSAPTASDGVYQVLDVEAARLISHTGEVFACQWNPKFPSVLATGASDATAVIWTFPRGRCSASAGKVASDSKKVLQHAPSQQASSRDVTTLEWSPDGSTLATGSYDGTARLWSVSGALTATLTGHNGPIFSLRWTSDSKYVLSGGVDRSARIWDAKQQKELKRFVVHNAPMLDVAWRDNTSFATCSSDKTVTYCRWDLPDPMHRWAEHTDEVNAVVWDPKCRLLASCSDDKTVRVWEPGKSQSVMTLVGHEREIYTVRWSPGQNSPERLLSASFDGTARLWEAETGVCLTKFPRRKQPVYAIEFSPDGLYCVIGSFDKTVEVFHVESAKSVQTFQAPAGVFDVDWGSAQNGGEKIAIATAKGAVTIIDVRRLPDQ